MSFGCAIVASDTAPVREAITHNKTGLLVVFFDTQQLCSSVCHLLENPKLRHATGLAARPRQAAIANYDLTSRYLPQQIARVEKLFNQS